MKAKNIDELCKSEPGSFKKFLKQKEAYLKKMDANRKARIHASRNTAREMSWAV